MELTFKTRAAILIATFFGAGRSPKAPGTVGSLATLPFAFVIHSQFGSTALLLSSIAIFFIGWWAAECYTKRFVDRGHDPKEIVIDEVAGQMLVLAALMPTWQSYLLGFIAFRFFDIVKPWPISYVDRKITSSFGTMLDDIMAGFYPVFLLLLLFYTSHLLDMPNLITPLSLFLGGYYGH